MFTFTNLTYPNDNGPRPTLAITEYSLNLVKSFKFLLLSANLFLGAYKSTFSLYHVIAIRRQNELESTWKQILLNIFHTD